MCIKPYKSLFRHKYGYSCIQKMLLLFPLSVPTGSSLLVSIPVELFIIVNCSLLFYSMDIPNLCNHFFLNGHLNFFPILLGLYTHNSEYACNYVHFAHVKLYVLNKRWMAGLKHVYTLLIDNCLIGAHKFWLTYTLQPHMKACFLTPLLTQWIIKVSQHAHQIGEKWYILVTWYFLHYD